MSGEEADIKPGNTLPLRNIPLGTMIHNIELKIGKGGQLVRSAGTAAQLMAKEGSYASIKLPSGEVRRVHQHCRATIGQVGNLDHEGPLRKSLDRSLDDGSGDATSERVGYEVMAVALGAEGEKHTPGLRDPRVERPADEGAALLDGTVDDAPTRRVEQVVEGEQARSNGNEAQGRSGGTRA